MFSLEQKCITVSVQLSRELLEIQPVQNIIETLVFSHVNATPKLPERVVIANTSVGYTLVGGRNPANFVIVLTRYRLL